MSDKGNGLEMFGEVIRWVRARPVPVAFGIILVTLFIALTGNTWVWFVGGLLVMLVLYPSLFNMQGASTGTKQVTGSTPTPPAPNATLDINQLQGHYRELMQRALDARHNIETAIGQTQDPGQRQVLAQATEALPELTGSIYNLALKAQGVQAALGSTNPVNRLTDEIKQIEEQIKNTPDEFQKSQYYAAMDGKLQQMQNITDTTVAMRRWDSQIENALSTMDTLLSQVLRIKSSEVLSYTGATDELSNSLKREVDSLKATSEAMNSVYGWGGASKT